MTGEICPYCSEDPCTCPVLDVPDETQDPDDPTCPDSEPDEEPTFEDCFILAVAAKLRFV